MFDKKYLNISEIADILNLSITTLRRWDRSGKLKAIRTEGGQRRYSVESLKNILKEDLFWGAKFWALEEIPYEPDKMSYCQTRSIFEARLAVMEKLLMNNVGEIYSIISSSVGEIGNNSYDHNLGNWHDIPGIYFSYNFDKRHIVLADRGQGILKTLQNATPIISDHKSALKLAFTEVITGRIPEKRGNGLKYVRRNIEKGYFAIKFQTGDAELNLKSGELLSDKSIINTKNGISGCLALITF